MRQGFCGARSRTDGCSHAEGLPWVGCTTGAVLEKTPSVNTSVSWYYSAVKQKRITEQSVVQNRRMLTFVVISHHWTVCNCTCYISCVWGKKFLNRDSLAKSRSCWIRFFIFSHKQLIGPAVKCFITYVIPF